MNFKPVDEMSLRHLFSSDYGRSMLRLSYIGPVLSPTGRIDPSPDALVLDMRNDPYRVRRCEFKYSPASVDEFAHNGQFDLAIMWSITSPLTKDRLADGLRTMNSCHEYLILSEQAAFARLPTYSAESIAGAFKIETHERTLLRFTNSLPSVYALYIASKVSPERFDLKKLVNLLASKFGSVRDMAPQGRSNVVTASLQSSPPFIKKAYGNAYEWVSDFDPVSSSAFLEEMLTVSFRFSLPTVDEIRSVIHSGF